MKYSEFKTKVEKLGFVVVSENGSPVYVDKEVGGETILSVGIHKNFHVDPNWSGFSGLSEQQKTEIFELGCELAKTPLTEREEEKRYLLIIKIPTYVKYGPYYYLNLNTLTNEYTLNHSMNIPPFKTIFTESECAEMDLTHLQKIEVIK